MAEASLFPMSIVLLATLIAAATDLRAFKVHNLLTVPLLITGFVYHAASGGPPALANSLLGAAFSFCILFMFYLLGGMGGGDVKLMMAVGAWLGLPLTFFVFVVSSVAGGIYALVLIYASGNVRDTWINLKIIWHRVAAMARYFVAEDRLEAEVNRVDRRRRLIPFAAMVALGVATVLIWSWFHGEP
jgi:prepilin peptidase CpaA